MNTNSALHRSVDLKIFEIQAALLDSECTSSHLDFAQKWLTPTLYNDIIEERNAQNLCGYPLCQKQIPKSNENQKYRISYKDKRVYEIEQSSNYCCVECNTKSHLFGQSLDDSPPHSRSIASTLRSEPASFQLDALLDLISPSTEKNPKQANSEVLHDGPDTRNGLRTLDTTMTASIVAGTRSIKSLTSKLQMQQELYSNDHLMSQNISAMMASQTSDGTTVISSTTSTHMGYQPSLSLGDPVYSNKPSKTTEQSNGRTSSSSNVSDISTLLEKIVNNEGKTDAQDSTPNKSVKVKKSVGFGADEVRIFKRFSKVNEQYPEDYEHERFSKESEPKIEKADLDVSIASVLSDESGDDTTDVALTETDIVVDEWLSHQWGKIEIDHPNGTSDQEAPPMKSGVFGERKAGRSVEAMYEIPHGLTQQKVHAWEEPKVAHSLDTALANKNVESEDKVESVSTATTYKRPIIRKKKKANSGIDASTPSPSSSAEQDLHVIMVDQHIDDPDTHSKNDDKNANQLSAVYPQRSRLSSKDGIDASTNLNSEEKSSILSHSKSEPALPSNMKPALKNNKTKKNPSGKSEEKNVNSNNIMKPFVVERQPPKLNHMSDNKAISDVKGTVIDEKYAELNAGVSLSDDNNSTHIEKSNVTDVADGKVNTDSNEDDEHYDQLIEDIGIHVSNRTLLSNLSIPNPLMKSTAPTEEDKIIWKELFGEDIPESDLMTVEDGNEEEKYDAVEAQNFFMMIWSTLEDMFDSDTVSWLNTNDESNLNDGIDGHDAVLSDEHEDKDIMHDMENSNVSNMLDANELSSMSGIMLLFRRSLKRTESIINISNILNNNYKVINKYNSIKNELLIRIHYNKSNPTFNSSQWCLCSLLLIDAIIKKRIINNIDTSSDVETNSATFLTLDQWNTTFNVFAAGILGGVKAASRCLDARELQLLRTFFDIEQFDDVVTDDYVEVDDN